MLILSEYKSLFKNPFLQGAFANKLKLFIEKPKYQKYYIKHKDDQYSTLDVQHSNTNRAVITFHGLGGNSSSNYCSYISNELKKCNTASIIYNRRGHDISCLEYPEHYIETDITDILNSVRDMGYTEIYAIGVSIAGNLVIKYAAKHTNAFEKIITLSSTFDFYYGFERVKGDKKVQSFLKDCSMDIAKNSKNCRLSPSMHFETILEQEGFLLNKSHEDMITYYKEISAINCLHKIKTPMLCINSLDDPVIKISLDKYQDMLRLNSNITFILTTYGSHCSWVSLFGEFMPNIYIKNFFELS